MKPPLLATPGLALCLAALLSPIARAASGESARWTNGLHHLVVDGRDRTFLLDVPTHLKPGASLVLVFHGFTGTAAGVRAMTRFTPLVEKHGFVAVYPEGTRDSEGRSFFNVGYQFHQSQTVDDVAFARAIADRLAADLALDRRAIFATGFSNGGDMSFFLGAQPDPFVAAIAPVAGTMMSSWARTFRPAARIPVLAVNMVHDRTTLWHGDLLNLDGWGAYLDTESVLGLWVRGLSLERSQRANLPRNIRFSRWSTAADGTEVQFYELGKGGHHWPPSLGDGRRTTAETVWQFFAAHRPQS